MRKLKEIFRGEHGGFIQFVAYSTVFTLLLMTFAPGNNIINWARARIEIARQEKQIREYAAEIDEMERKIRKLSSDRDTLEKFAREEFNFSAPGDDVYIVEE